ncbi:hypothetical protein [Bacteroides acidifaciens]|jgi:hypothetical protein|uniref:hypothetical protein n=1 Tax=Bacteroides acidifaciens TaxID=85831 RepID=UPI000F49E217|nr:hypothetical protein [Bacteroides acidifaciens]ROS87163.1 hypothetical protein EEL39_10375 [Muribaculaceae bacterium Isolate-080 (Janvier)]
MQKHLNAIRTVALICIAGKAVSISFAGAEDGLPLSVTINSLLINFLLLTLLYFSVEFAVRFFIWPQTRSIHAIAVFRKNKKTAVAKAEEPEPVKPVSPLETPKVKEVIAYTLGTFAGVLTNEELMALDKNLKAFILGERELPAAVNRRISHLRTNDIYHFGWNIARRLKISNDVMAVFLKSQFVWHLDDSALSTISKKLSYEIGKFTIPKVNPKETLLPFPLAKELGVC